MISASKSLAKATRSGRTPAPAKARVLPIARVVVMTAKKCISNRDVELKGEFVEEKISARSKIV